MANKTAPVDPASFSDSQALTLFQPSTALRKLPPKLQEALSKYRTREAAGVAPQWKPVKEGEFLIGTVSSIRDVETEFGQSIVVTFNTPDGPQAIFLGADLKVKLADAQKDQAYVITYDGKMTKAENPKLKNDMKKFTVIEIMPD